MIGFIYSNTLFYLLAEMHVCYGKYGCFSNGEPFKSIVLLPFPPVLIAPQFRLYTRLNPDKPQFIDDNDLTKLQISSYNGSKRTVFVVHGYIGKLKNNCLSREVNDSPSYINNNLHLARKYARIFVREHYLF